MSALHAPSLAWLLGCLTSAVECLDWCGRDVDARVIEAHRAALARGEEWYGDAITSNVALDEPALYALGSVAGVVQPDRDDG